MQKQYYKTKPYYAWGGLYKFTYGKTVEEMAVLYAEEEAKDLEGFGPE